MGLFVQGHKLPLFRIGFVTIRDNDVIKLSGFTNNLPSGVFLEYLLTR